MSLKRFGSLLPDQYRLIDLFVLDQKLDVIMNVPHLERLAGLD